LADYTSQFLHKSQLQAFLRVKKNKEFADLRVKKDGTTLGHVPKTISQVYSIFFYGRDLILCRVTGHRRYFADLIQEGLDIHAH